MVYRGQQRGADESSEALKEKIGKWNLEDDLHEPRYYLFCDGFFFSYVRFHSKKRNVLELI